jgi:hypothetical protein
MCIAIAHVRVVRFPVAARGTQAWECTDSRRDARAAAPSIPSQPQAARRAPRVWIANGRHPAHLVLGLGERTS